MPCVLIIARDDVIIHHYDRFMHFSFTPWILALANQIRTVEMSLASAIFNTLNAINDLSIVALYQSYHIIKKPASKGYQNAYIDLNILINP